MKKGRIIDTNKLILRILITFLGTAGVSSVFVSVTENYAGLGLVMMVSALFSVLDTIILSAGSRWHRFVALLVPVHIYGIINIKNIYNGTKTITYMFMDKAAADLGQTDELLYSKADAGNVVLITLILWIMFIAILAALEVNVFTNMLFSLIIVIPVLAVFVAAVIIPPTISIVFSILFIFDSMALGKRKKRNTNANIMVIASFVVAGIVLIIMPESAYSRSDFFENARDMVSDFAYDQFGVDLDGRSEESVNEEAVNAAVGIGDGHIGQIDQLYYNDEEVGTYRTVSNGATQYISLFKAREYESNNWTKWIDTREKQYTYTNNVHDFVLNLTKRKLYNLEKDEQALVDRLKFYSPTFTDSKGMHPELNNDVEYYIKDGTLLNYTQMGQLMKKYRSDNVFDSYENFVNKSQYLTVRNEDREAVGKIFESRTFSNEVEKAEYINYVCDYLRKNYSYTMRPGKVPEGRNAVDYFLNESKRGYCTYFATAAAVILRCSGIPTRYCAGYVVDTSLSGTQNSDYYDNYIVMDNSAHAWVEVFISGYGWVTIDPTPGYGDDLPEEDTQASTEATQSDSETDDGMQEFNGSVGNTADNTSTEDNYDYDSLTGFSTSKGLGIGKIHINVRYIVAAFAGLIVMVLVMIFILRIVSRNVLLNPDKADDKKLFRLYNYLEKLLAFSGFERLSSEDYQDYIYRIIEAESSLQGIGLEKAVQTILEVRFGNVKCVDKADITGIINTIRQVRSYALKKARGLKKLIVCLI